MIEKWHTVEIKTDDLSKDSVANFLIELGSSGNEELQNSIKGYFREEKWNKNKENRLRTYLKSINELGYATKINGIRIIEHDARSWLKAWKKNYKEVVISDKVIIVPPWKSENDEKEVVIEPGMAFGTGTHETTKLVLKLMTDYIKDGDEICDLGTGSGILAITSLKLGAKRAVAIDISEDAITDARKNIELNRFGEQITLVKGGFEIVGEQIFNLVLANIDFNILLENKEKIRRSVKQGGYILVSGILEIEKDVFNTQFKANNLYLEKEEILGEWVGLAYRRIK